jgi:hypothetical protein
MLYPAVIWSQTESRIALVIGNAAYEALPALKNPVNDAADVSAALKKIGWNVIECYDADRRTMLRGLDSFQAALQKSPESMALFFYAGHGIQADGTNYLIPLDEVIETKADVKIASVTIDMVNAAFDEGKALTSITILDACREDPFPKGTTRNIGLSRGLSVVPARESSGGSVTIFATAAGDVAMDGDGKNGIFTSAFLKYIESGRSLSDIFLAVVGEVKTSTEGRQTPFITTSGILSSLYLSDRRAPEAAPLPSAEKMAGKARFTSPVQGVVYLGTEAIGDVGPGKDLNADSLPTGRLSFTLRDTEGRDLESQSSTVSEMATAQVSFSLPPPASAVLGAKAQTAEPPAAPEDPNVKLASLRAERKTQVDSIASKNHAARPALIAQYASWGGLVFSAGTMIVSMAAGDHAIQSYNGALDTVTRDEWYSKVHTWNYTYKVGLLCGAGFLAGGITSLFFAPDTRAERRAIQYLDKEIMSLNAKEGQKK